MLVVAAQNLPLNLQLHDGLSHPSPYGPQLHCCCLFQSPGRLVKMGHASAPVPLNLLLVLLLMCLRHRPAQELEIQETICWQELRLPC